MYINDVETEVTVKKGDGDKAIALKNRARGWRVRFPWRNNNGFRNCNSKEAPRPSRTPVCMWT